MNQAMRFNFKSDQIDLNQHSGLPFLPLQLNLNTNSITTSALLDTGSAVNVMPYDIGLQLGKF